MRLHGPVGADQPIVVQPEARLQAEQREMIRHRVGHGGNNQLVRDSPLQRASPPKRAARRRAGATASNAERLAAAATITLVGIVESKTPVQTAATEIKLGAVNKRQPLRGDDDLPPMSLERPVIGAELVGILQP